MRRQPELFTERFAKAGRDDRILVDYLRNNRANTSVAAYSTRAKPDAPSVPVPTTTPSPKATGQAAVESAPRSAPPAVPATPLAQPATVAEYLNSDDPVPQRFSLDAVGFAHRHHVVHRDLKPSNMLVDEDV